MKNNIILVDLFDTLVFRKARLYRLVRYWAEELCRCFEMNMSAQEIIRMRGEFYDTLLTQNEEVKYSALIRKIYLSLSQEQLLENTTFEEFFSICHYLELKYEIQSQFINEKLVRWLRDQKSLNKRIYCISDFYLSREDVLHFLHKLEIDDIFSDVFVSCDWNQTKRSGNLYRKVLEEIQAAPEDCLMIGDNLKSDIRMAKKQSIKAKHVPRYLHVIKNFVYQIKDDKRQRKIILQGLARKYKNKKSPFCEFVLFFYILTEKIYVNARRDHLKNLIFLSREGLFLKKMFDYYQENCVPPERRLSTYYLQVSRKALSNAVFDLLKNPLPTINSISSFINSIDIPEDIIKKLPEMGEFDFSEIIDDFPHSVQYQTLLESESFNGIYAGAHKKNKDAFDTYLKKFPFDDCAFVDVGWAGTMQKALSSYLGKKTLGYYLGVNIVNFSDPFLLDQSVTMKGIMFSNYPVKSKYYDCFAGNVPVYELFISAPHGGAISYGIDGGEVSIKTEWIEDEKYTYHNFSEPFQQAIWPHFQEICGSLTGCPYEEIDNEVIMNMTVRSFLFPSKPALHFIYNAYYYYFNNFQTNNLGVDILGKSNIRTVLSSQGEPLLVSILKHPEEYVRYFNKVPLFLHTKKAGWLAPAVTLPFYLYFKLRVKSRSK